MPSLMKFSNRFHQLFLGFRNHEFSQQVRRTDFTIIASNCVGGTIYRDLGIEYSSPFVGLFILPKDFVQLCEHLEYYLNLPLIEDNSLRMNYPVGKLGDISVHFVHYRDFPEAKTKWERRILRVNFSSLVFILVERDGCTFADIKKFDNLPYEKKVILTAHSYPMIQSAFQLQTYSRSTEVGDCTGFVFSRLGFRHMYQFDFAGLLNQV